MSVIFSFEDQDFAVVSDAMRLVVSSAYAQKGTSVQIPSDVVRDSCRDLSAKTADQILAIRRQERTVSSKTLAFSFA